MIRQIPYAHSAQNLIIIGCFWHVHPLCPLFIHGLAAILRRFKLSRKATSRFCTRKAANLALFREIISYAMPIFRKKAGL